MTLDTFDRLGAVIVSLVLGFSAGVATNWEWFPTEEWADIAHVPPTSVNYAALLLPWVSLLIFLLLRRRWFRKLR